MKGWALPIRPSHQWNFPSKPDGCSRAPSLWLLSLLLRCNQLWSRPSHRGIDRVDVNWRPTFWDARPPGRWARATAIELIRPLLEQAALIKLAREEAIWLFGADDPGAIRAALPQRAGCGGHRWSGPGALVPGWSVRYSACFSPAAGGRHHRRW